MPLASVPYIVSRLQAREATWFRRIDEVPHSVDRDWLRRLGLQSAVVVPVAGCPEPLGALAFGSATREHEWVPAIIEHLRLVSGACGQAMARQAGHAALQCALDELHRLRDRAGVLRRPAVRAARTARAMVWDSPAAKRVIAQVEQVAATPATVLLLGETGVGKEVIAQAIHDCSPRRQRPMVRVSCAAIPSHLIESELFGHERGAYTGALARQIGRFEAANQSTIFLDEIGELPADMQVKLLRVLQERAIERLGSNQSIKVDIRVIAATNRNLEQAVEDKSFREDLLLSPQRVPHRRAAAAGARRGHPGPGLGVHRRILPGVRQVDRPRFRASRCGNSSATAWPGNVRELRNVIERAVILANDTQLTVTMREPSPAGHRRR